MRGYVGSLALLATVLTASSADEATSENPDDIAAELNERDKKNHRWSFPLLDQWNEARKRIEKESGLNWSASYHSVALGAALGDGVPVGASGDFTLQGIWAPGFRWSENPAQLRFRMRHRHAYAGTSASELGPEIGALWGVVDGFSNSGFEIPDLFLRHVFEKPNIELRYGQLSIDSQFGGHQLASSKRFFLNQAFASDPGVAFPRFGAGFTALLKTEKGFSVGIGTTTVQGTQTGSQVDLDFGSGALFQALQLAYDFRDQDKLSRRVQFLGWHSDAVEDSGRPEGQGFSLTYEQQLDEQGSRYFARFSWSDGGAASLDYLLSLGYSRPCGEKDFAGVALAMGQSSDSEKEFQTAIECSYRWHFRDNLLITPDVQVLFGEGFDGGPGIRLVAGVRIGITF